MTDRFAERHPGDQFLGEIATEIVAKGRSVPAIQPGDKVYFEPGHAALHGPHTVIVENCDAELLGFLPKRLIAWLGPLLQRGAIRLEGFVPVAAQSPAVKAGRPAIVLTIYQTCHSDLVGPIVPTNELETVHEIVRHAYSLAQRFAKPEMIRDLSKRLAEFERQPLLPETRLLLALLPRLVHELHACDGMESIVELQNELATLVIGPPIEHNGLTFFSLLWPDRAPPPIVTLDTAVANGEAEIVEVAPTAGGEAVFFAVNHSRQPLLVPNGAVVCGICRKGVVSTTLLLASESRLALPTCTEQHWLAQRAHCEADEKRSPQQSRSELVGIPKPQITASAAGVVAAASGRIIGIDLFASASAFQAAWETLADAYFLLTQPNFPAATVISQDTVRKFIERLAGAARPRNAASGIGCEMEILTDDLVGRALVYERQVCHLTARVRASR